MGIHQVFSRVWWLESGFNGILMGFHVKQALSVPPGWKSCGSITFTNGLAMVIQRSFFEISSGNGKTMDISGLNGKYTPCAKSTVQCSRLIGTIIPPIFVFFFAANHPTAKMIIERMRPPPEVCHDLSILLPSVSAFNSAKLCSAWWRSWIPA